MIRHLIWDFDGTLYDTYPAIAAAYAQTLEACGFSVGFDEIMAQITVSMGHARSYFDAKFGLPDGFDARLQSLRRSAEMSLARPFLGAEETLRAWLTQGGTNDILTHRSRSIHALLEKHGFDSLIRACVTSDDGFPRKPDPAGLRWLLETYAMRPDETLMVGDRPLDIEAGKNAGVRTCFFDPAGKGGADADFTVRDFTGLRTLLNIGSE